MGSFVSCFMFRISEWKKWQGVSKENARWKHSFQELRFGKAQLTRNKRAEKSINNVVECKCDPGVFFLFLFLIISLAVHVYRMWLQTQRICFLLSINSLENRNKALYSGLGLICFIIIMFWKKSHWKRCVGFFFLKTNQRFSDLTTMLCYLLWMLSRFTIYKQPGKIKIDLRATK